VDGPTASYAKVELFKSNEKAARLKFKRIAIDTSKHVFTLHGVDEQEQPVLRRELKRGQVQNFSVSCLIRKWFWRLAVVTPLGPVC
jgi:hypothetical protein